MAKVSVSLISLERIADIKKLKKEKKKNNNNFTPINSK